MNTSINTLKVRRDAKLKQLAQVGPFVQGSLYLKQIRCGVPSCKCARGEPHQAHVLTGKVRGKTKTTHVPRDLHEEVAQWVAESKRIKKLVKEISALSEQIIRMHVSTSRAVARNRNRAKHLLDQSSLPPSGTSSPTSCSG